MFRSGALSKQRIFYFVARMILSSWYQPNIGLDRFVLDKWMDGWMDELF